MNFCGMHLSNMKDDLYAVMKHQRTHDITSGYNYIPFTVTVLLLFVQQKHILIQLWGWNNSSIKIIWKKIHRPHWKSVIKQPFMPTQIGIGFCITSDPQPVTHVMFKINLLDQSVFLHWILFWVKINSAAPHVLTDFTVNVNTKGRFIWNFISNV